MWRELFRAMNGHTYIGELKVGKESFPHSLLHESCAFWNFPQKKTDNSCPLGTLDSKTSSTWWSLAGSLQQTFFCICVLELNGSNFSQVIQIPAQLHKARIANFIVFICSKDTITSRSYKHLVKHIRTNEISLYCIPVDWSENQSVRSLIGVSLPGHTGCSANNSVAANSAESPAPVMKRLQFVLGLIQYRDDQNFTSVVYKTKDKILTTFCCCINQQFKQNIPWCNHLVLACQFKSLVILKLESLEPGKTDTYSRITAIKPVHLHHAAS